MNTKPVGIPTANATAFGKLSICYYYLENVAKRERKQNLHYHPLDFESSANFKEEEFSIHSPFTLFFFVRETKRSVILVAERRTNDHCHSNGLMLLSGNTSPIIFFWIAKKLTLKHDPSTDAQPLKAFSYEMHPETPIPGFCPVDN